MPPKPKVPKFAKEFESAIRRNSPGTAQSSKLTLESNTTVQRSSNDENKKVLPLPPPRKESLVSITPSATAPTVNVNVSEVTFLAESDLFLEEEDKDLDPKTSQEKREIAINIYKSFKPIVYLLKVLGRWPLTSSQRPDGSREFEWNWRRPGAIYYIIVTTISLYTLIIGSWSMMGIFMDVKIVKGPKDTTEIIRFQYEKTILKRHLATFVMLWTSLIHCVVTSITLISRKKYMAFYFTFWTRCMPTMQMNVAKGTFRWMMAMILCYVSSILTLVILSVVNVGPSAVTAPTLFGILMFREYLEPLYQLKKIDVSKQNVTEEITSATTEIPTNPVYRYELIENSPSGKQAINILGGVFLLLIFSASKVYMFVFIYICKLLKNAFSQWNARVYASILRGSQQPQKHESRTTFTLLFRDHCLLLDLMDGTDQLFANILESYFFLQVCSICFEGYFFIRTARYAENIKDSEEYEYFVRHLDWIPAVVVFIQSIALLLVVTYSAAEVGEEAMAGFEVLRRRSLMGRKTNDELYFMLTMFASYTAYKRIELSAGGYFYINKELLIGVMSTILSYFIIIYQFRPPLDYQYELLASNSTKDYKREILADFLTRIEGIKVHPYEPRNNMSIT